MSHQSALIATDIDTLADGEPRNNFFKRAVTWNPGGVLTGARQIILDAPWIAVVRQLVRALG